MQSHSNSIQCWCSTNFTKLNITKPRVIHSAKKKVLINMYRLWLQFGTTVQLTGERERK